MDEASDLESTSLSPKRAKLATPDCKIDDDVDKETPEFDLRTPASDEWTVLEEDLMAMKEAEVDMEKAVRLRMKVTEAFLAKDHVKLRALASALHMDIGSSDDIR